MKTEMDELREHLAARDGRLSGLETRTVEIQDELRALARLLRGNGERGLVGEIEIQRERIEVLQAQWKWIIGVLMALAVAVIQALFRR